jgi:hypothetical protein
MRTRGTKYWDWANFDLHVRNHDERLPDGTLINVQVRHHPACGTQLFIGAYARSGTMIFEEFYEARPGESMTQAVAWGVDHAKTFVRPNGATAGHGRPHAQPKRLQRKGARCYK